jgi:hypothetical protein
LAELLPLVGLLASLGASFAFGLPTGLIVLGGGLLLLGVWNLWVSLQILAGDRPGEERAVDPGAPSTEEEQKAFLLRALQDLDFERSVGKIDDDDYEELRDQYRSRAKQALMGASRAGGPSLEEAEKEVQAYLRQRCTSPPSRKQLDDLEGIRVTPRDTLKCPSCGTVNDPDARFCKRCGKKMGDEQPSEQGEAS